MYYFIFLILNKFFKSKNINIRTNLVNKNLYKFSIFNSLLEIQNINNISFKLFFNDISHYTYIHDINVDVFFNNSKQKFLFKEFKRHPLIHWKLQVSLYNNNILLFDLITNITNNINKFNPVTINNVYYINDPCLIYRNNEFLLNFSKNNNNKDFIQSKQYISLYQEILLERIKENKYNKGIFLQEFYNGVHLEQYKYRINMYNKLY